MTAKFDEPPEGTPEYPASEIIRMSRGSEVFGFGPTVIAEKIKTCEIPKPFPLGDNGRAQAWFGWQINQHHRKIREKAPEREAARKAKRHAERAAREAKAAEQAASTKRLKRDRQSAD